MITVSVKYPAIARGHVERSGRMAAPRPIRPTNTSTPTWNGAASATAVISSTTRPVPNAASAAAAIVRKPASRRLTTEQLTTVMAPVTASAIDQKTGWPSSTNDARSTHAASVDVVMSHVDHGVTTLITIHPNRAATAKPHIGAPAIASVDIDATVAASGAADSQLPPLRRALPAVHAINAALHSASGKYQRSSATTSAGASQRAASVTNGEISAAVASPTPIGTVAVRAS